MRIYVGNLPYEMAEEELQKTFVVYGQVESATVIRDRQTGRSKGFGFVEMLSASEAKAAIQALNGQPYQSRNLTVNEAEARPREEGSGFGGGRGGMR